MSKLAWEAPVVSAISIRATAAQRHWYIDGFWGGTILDVTPPIDAPANPGACQDRPVRRDRCNPTGRWEAPAVTTMSIRAGTAG